MHVESLHYPALARQTRTQGEVKVSAMVDKTGSVILPIASEGHALLRQAVLDNVRKWKFQPPSSSFTIEITYTFMIKEQSEPYSNGKVLFDLPHHVQIEASPAVLEAIP
jgi:TonB family protein